MSRRKEWVLLRLDSTGYVGVFPLKDWEDHVQRHDSPGWTELTRTTTRKEVEALRKLMMASQEGT